MSKLKAGRVATIRINPADCMSIADAIAKLNLDPALMTFDQAVRIALSSSLEGLRTNGVLPRRDGFEFSELMNAFRASPRGFKGKLEFTQLVDSVGTIRPIVQDAAREARRARFNEMSLHFEADPLNHPKPQPGEQGWEEWEKLCAEFFNG